MRDGDESIQGEGEHVAQAFRSRIFNLSRWSSLLHPRCFSDETGGEGMRRRKRRGGRPDELYQQDASTAMGLLESIRNL